MKPEPRDNRQNYLTKFESFKKTLLDDETSSIQSIRQSAIKQLGDKGFPTNKDEEWRFTNILPLTKVDFTPASKLDIGATLRQKLDELLIKGLKGYRLVFVNGFLVDDLSDLQTNSGKVKVNNLRTMMKSDAGFIEQHLTSISKNDNSAFTALNTGFMDDGSIIQVADNTIVDEPIYIIYFSTQNDASFITHPRNLIITGKNSRASFIEHYISFDGNFYFTNSVTEIIVGENAFLTHTKIQTESKKAYHIASTFIHQKSGSNLTSNSIMIGSSIARNNIISTLDGEVIECTLNGLSLATDEQLIDNHTTIDHSKPNCVSHELYKSILDGKSKGVFNGKIYVRKNAQKTDARQTNKTLLLSDVATMNTKPQLEIFADDVKCTHGATIGYLDIDSIFYLRSRGIDEGTARDILTYAFANDVVNRIPNEAIREYVNDILHSRLSHNPD